MELVRKIIHVDMDAFYASVEQHDFPELRDRPIAVGGSTSGRGVVATASYQARKFGVRSAMSSINALRLCPDIIFVKPRMERYREISAIVRKVFYEYSNLVEPLSLDEAYLDVTSDLKGIGSATLVAEAILSDIKRQTGLTASAGISYNKFLAKIASELNKPDGKATILPGQAEALLATLPMRKFHGVGKATEQKMAAAGILFGRDLKLRSLDELTERFGKSGNYFYNVVRGIDRRSVSSNRIRKSVSAERTFLENKVSEAEIKLAISEVAEKLMDRVARISALGFTVTLKVKFSDFTIISRSITLPRPVADLQLAVEVLSYLFSQVEFNRAIRLIGAGLSNLKSTREPDKLKQTSFSFFDDGVPEFLR